MYENSKNIVCSSQKIKNYDRKHKRVKSYLRFSLARLEAFPDKLNILCNYKLNSVQDKEMLHLS